MNRHASTTPTLPRAALAAAALALAAAPRPALAAGYQQTDLVTDNQAVLSGLGYAPAANVDPSLVNPWGVSFGPGGPFWISDNGTGLTTLYNGAGVKQGLIVTIPPPTGAAPPSAPTGQVFNSAGAANFAGASFLFDTEDGTLSSWAGANGTNAVLRVDNSATNYGGGLVGAVYKGLGLGSTSGGANELFAANFRSGMLDVFNSTFGAAGSFTDPTLPAGYAPFNVQNLGGTLYVTFAAQDTTHHDEVDGLGLGFLDTFNPNTNTFTRVASQGTLDAPWGLALAPASFGTFGGDLLVGNFGDGRINAYNPGNGQFLGQLAGTGGAPLSIDGLWALQTGNGGNGGSASQVYFTAGINGEQNGLLGSLAPQAAVPEPGSLALLGLGLLPLAAAVRRRGRINE